MDAILWQERLTLRTGRAQTISQGESGYLDVSCFDDLALWLDVAETSGGVTMQYQTSLSKDDAGFQALLPAITVGTGTRVDNVLWATVLTPVLKYVRWQISTTSAGDATFRIWVAARALGGA